VIKAALNKGIVLTCSFDTGTMPLLGEHMILDCVKEIEAGQFLRTKKVSKL
jgi:hypothetical protein